MRVAIAGGHGKVALHLTRRLEAAGDEVVSIIRDPSQGADIETAGGQPLVIDLEGSSAEEIAAAIGSADAIVFAAGAGPGSGNERKETVDYGAAVKMIEAGQKLDVKRYVMVSSMNADANREGDDAFDVYLRAKGRADQALISSPLEYAIVRPGRLTDDQGTGRVKAGHDVGPGEIPREDVAEVLSQALRTEAAADSVIDVIGGDTPIAEAISWF